MTAPDRRTISFAIRGPIARADLAGLCERVCALLTGSNATVALCDVSDVGRVDAVTVDALARLQLAARRHGCQIRLEHASQPLCELLAFMALRDVMPGESALEPGRQAEQRKQPLRAEEEGQLADAVTRELEHL
jgi:ABC-type transporter Mla MlaB component